MGNETIEVPREIGMKMPDNVTFPFTVSGGNTDSQSADSASAIADKEIAERLKQQQQGGQQQTPPVTPPQGQQQPQQPQTPQQPDTPEETEEQIQAKLNTLAEKEEKDLTEDDKAYIAKYVETDDSPIALAKNTLGETYAIDLGQEQFENTPQGLVRLVEIAAPQIAEQMLVGHFKEIPMMEDLYNHLRDGRSIDTFLVSKQKPAFETVELKEINDEMPENVSKSLVENQKYLIRVNLNSRGIAPDDIENFIDMAESGGKLFAKAVEAKKALQKGHSDLVAQQLQMEEQQIKAEEKRVQEVYNTMSSMIDKNNFDGLSIPAVDVRNFKRAVLEADDQGATYMDYKRSQMTLAQRLLIDYLVFTDFKGILQGAKPAQQKTFEFQKKAKDNDKREAGKLRGANSNLTVSNASTTSPTINVKEFLNNRFKSG